MYSDGNLQNLSIVRPHCAQVQGELNIGLSIVLLYPKTKANLLHILTVYYLNTSLNGWQKVARRLQHPTWSYSQLSHNLVTTLVE